MEDVPGQDAAPKTENKFEFDLAYPSNPGLSLSDCKGFQSILVCA